MKIAVLASGGVDSSLALRLLQEQGHDLTAFYLKIWLEDEAAFLGDCPWQTDLEYLSQVCRQLDVPLQVVPLQREYRQSVVEFALSELKAGRTPSPDIFCNRWIKFGRFYEEIDDSFQRVASGHYARILRPGGESNGGESEDGLCRLLRAPDPVKDQTYFLSHLTQRQLSRALFPIGHLRKSQVRELARRYRLPNQDRRDSQGICFLGKIKYSDFVRFHLGEREGRIIDAESGRELGPHCGYWFYTIGQRQGLGLGGGPWYVVGKDPKRNAVLVSHADVYLRRSRKDLVLARLNWIAGPPRRRQLGIKLRHGPKIVECRVRRLEPSSQSAADDDERWAVSMAEEDTGVAPGQFGILYDGQECLGGGVIEG
ncbi:MAG TPA: tRNA 2-thiouridine(34) synthase MnmA [Acidobacteriota bacterium]|nr:tRNA 2-thiouridine(34) synthase MnmA [Acidobacteriota bacterium]